MKEKKAQAKLGKNQIAMLKKIVATNGGGVIEFQLDLKIRQSLERRGLIQGKMGQAYYAVHTKAGLEFVRSLQAEVN